MKTALITGGSGDIGTAICYKLASQGIHVIVHSNRQWEKAMTVAETIKQQGGSAEVVSFDVTDSEKSEEIITQLSEKSTIQIIINNAGIHRDAPLAGMTRKDWSSVIDVALKGFYN
ncbi:MAG: SDR family NAD(P)-dependent oxidoreductase, partial [Methylococcales bacterium]|nr:SDR family NAD(P)-dependent oxidoreductase [Methylococcales bacterium]